MKQTTEDLLSFIKAAETSRKYMSNVASNFRTPLRLIDPELNEEEAGSIEVFKKNLDQIFASFYSRNQSKYSAASIEVYKRRMRALMSDFENYGGDPGKMAGWSREIITRKRVAKPFVEGKRELNSFIARDSAPVTNIVGVADSDVTKFEIPLSNGKAFILTPANITFEDIQKIIAYVNYLKSITTGQSADQTRNNKEEGNIQ